MVWTERTEKQKQTTQPMYQEMKIKMWIERKRFLASVPLIFVMRCWKHEYNFCQYTLLPLMRLRRARDVTYDWLDKALHSIR